jgi:hypothetical protein
VTSDTPMPEAVLRRRRLLLWSGLPVLVVLCVCAKLLSLGVLTGQATAGFASGDAVAVGSAAAGLRAANIIERHKAPFAEGDARVLAGDFEAARQLFEEALALSGPGDECVIRVNLVLSIERLGDARLAAQDPAGAGRLFAEGLAVVDGAPPGCLAGAGPAARDTKEKLDQAEARLRQKSADAEAGESNAAQPEGSKGESPVEADPQRQTQLDELKDSARDSQLERSNGQERGEYLRDGDYGTGPDKPW